jgi:hypothetical protein
MTKYLFLLCYIIHIIAEYLSSLADYYLMYRANEAAIRLEMDKLGLLDDDDLNSLGAPSTRSNHTTATGGNGSGMGVMRTLSLSARSAKLDKQIDDDVRALADQITTTTTGGAVSTTP